MTSLFQDLKDMTCEELLAEIRRLRNELAKRHADLRVDALKLPRTGPMSIKGHIDQFDGKQRRLRRLLNEFATRGCGGDTEDAWQFASADAPAAVDPATSRQIAAVAAAIGATAAVVAAVVTAPAWGGPAVAAACLAMFVGKA